MKNFLIVMTALLLTTGVALAEDVPSFENQFLKRINSLRADSGLGKLALDAKLTKASQGHADEMAAGDFFAHESRDPKKRMAADRADLAGYEWYNIYENLFQTPSDDDSILVDEAMKYWLDSPEHKINMTSEKADDMGIGISRRKGGGYLVVLMVGRD